MNSETHPTPLREHYLSMSPQPEINECKQDYATCLASSTSRYDCDRELNMCMQRYGTMLSMYEFFDNKNNSTLLKNPKHPREQRR